MITSIASDSGVTSDPGVTSGLDRIRQLTESLGPPEGVVMAPGLKQYKTIDGEMLAWTIHWQEDFAICHAFLSDGSRIQQHIHYEKEWVIVVRGQIIVKTNTDTTVVNPREDIVIEPNTPHEVSSKADAYIIAITMPAAADWPKPKR